MEVGFIEMDNLVFNYMLISLVYHYIDAETHIVGIIIMYNVVSVF